PVTAGGAGTLARHCTLVEAGTPRRTGGVMSCTRMVCTPTAMLVQSSVAVQVRVISSGQVPLVTETSVTVTLVSQLSVAVTGGGAGTEERHSKTWLVGTPT